MEPDTYEEFSPKRDFFAITLAGVERKATNQREIGAGVMLDKRHFSLNTIAVYSDVERDKLGERTPELKRDGYRVENRLYLNISVQEKRLHHRILSKL